MSLSFKAKISNSRIYINVWHKKVLASQFLILHKVPISLSKNTTVRRSERTKKKEGKNKRKESVTHSERRRKERKKERKKK